MPLFVRRGGKTDDGGGRERREKGTETDRERKKGRDMQVLMRDSMMDSTCLESFFARPLVRDSSLPLRSLSRFSAAWRTASGSTCGQLRNFNSAAWAGTWR